MNRLGEIKRYRYLATGVLDEVTDFNGKTTGYDYDPVGRPVEVAFSDGSRNLFAWDSAGNILSAKNVSAELEYEYDVFGRLSSATDVFKDQRIDYGYDERGNRTSLSWADGSRTIEYGYDEVSRMSFLTDSEGARTEFDYDQVGRETERRYPNGVVRRTDYDEAGRTVAITQSGPGRDHWSTGFLESYAYGYDDAGRQVFRMDEQGRINVYEYDEAGRIAAVHYPMAGGKSINDLWERIYLGVLSKELQCSEPDADKPGSRDAFREKLEQLLDDSPELTEMGFNVEEYLYKLEETVSGQAEVFETLEDFSWSFTEEESASASRATTQRYGHGGGWSGWGGTQNRRGWGRWNWNGYANRLPSGAHGWFASWKLPGYWHQAQWSEEYSYDERGNIVSKSNGWGTIEYEYDEENRLMRAGEREYGYDGNGNLTEETIGTMWAQYEYTPEDRVSSVITNQPGFISTVSQELEIGVAYGYDALGRRVSREEIVDLEASLGIERYGSRKNRESYLYDGLGFDILAEGRDATKTESSGGWYTRSGRDFTPTTEYLYAGGTVIGRNDIAGGAFGAGAYGSEVKPSYYGQDILGSVVLETNEDGTKQKSYDYDAYGQLIEGKYSRISDIGYTGKRIDEVAGWYNYGYRDYDPMVMRFTTVDPIRSGSNWYAYVDGDPVNRVDLWGLCESDNRTDRWEAYSVEASTSVAVLGFEGIMGNVGSAIVTFRNTDDTESEVIVGVYNYSVRGYTGIAIEVGASLEGVYVYADLPENVSAQDVVKSYEGSFYSLNLSIGPVTGSSIYSELWSGASLGISAGLGAGVIAKETDYILVSYTVVGEKE